MIRTALAVALAALATVPPQAGASRLVYGCGYELCSISPDGSGRKRLTHDGSRSTIDLYREPSVSRSGRRMAFVRGLHPTASQIFVADRNARHRRLVSLRSMDQAYAPKMRPDGGAVMWQSGISGGDLCGTPLRRRLTVRCAGRISVEGSWAPGNRFLIRDDDWTGIVSRIDGRDRSRTIVMKELEDAMPSAQEFSPDGRRIAVVEWIKTGGARIAVYDARTGRRLRALTAGHSDTHPAWSPDGRWIAFWRDPENPGDGLSPVGLTASIERVPARGGPVRPVVKRRHDVGPATWGR